jgi:hypothetical protein
MKRVSSPSVIISGDIKSIVFKLSFFSIKLVSYN